MNYFISGALTLVIGFILGFIFLSNVKKDKTIAERKKEYENKNLDNFVNNDTINDITRAVGDGRKRFSDRIRELLQGFGRSNSNRSNNTNSK